MLTEAFGWSFLKIDTNTTSWTPQHLNELTKNNCKIAYTTAQKFDLLLYFASIDVDTCLFSMENHPIGSIQTHHIHKLLVSKSMRSTGKRFAFAWYMFELVISRSAKQIVVCEGYKWNKICVKVCV